MFFKKKIYLVIIWISIVLYNFYWIFYFQLNYKNSEITTYAIMSYLIIIIINLPVSILFLIFINILEYFISSFYLNVFSLILMSIFGYYQWFILLPKYLSNKNRKDKIRNKK